MEEDIYIYINREKIKTTSGTGEITRTPYINYIIMREVIVNTQKRNEVAAKFTDVGNLIKKLILPSTLEDVLEELKNTVKFFIKIYSL